MNISEKAAYLKGLYDGMKFDSSTDQGRLFTSIIELLGDLAATITNHDDELLQLGDDLDELSDEVLAIEDDIYDEDEEGDSDESSSIYQVLCPTCGENICIDEDLLESGEMKCPACGEDLEFDLSDLEEDEGCCCGCEDEDEKE